MSLLAELQEAVAAVATAAAPSVVGIGSRTRGSGVVIADGAVLTNAHNLRGGEVTVQVTEATERLLESLQVRGAAAS